MALGQKAWGSCKSCQLSPYPGIGGEGFGSLQVIENFPEPCFSSQKLIVTTEHPFSLYLSDVVVTIHWGQPLGVIRLGFRGTQNNLPREHLNIIHPKPKSPFVSHSYLLTPPLLLFLAFISPLPLGFPILANITTTTFPSPF